MHNPRDRHSRSRDGPFLAPPSLPALDLLADRTRREIIWQLAHEPCTVTELARRLDQTQPLISKHLRLLRNAGLVEARPGDGDGRARIYDLQREPLIRLEAWLHDLQQLWWRRTRHTPVDPDYYKEHRLDPNKTTRGTPRIRNIRQLKDPWER